jgi:phospholipase/carboxylesterase
MNTSIVVQKPRNDGQLVQSLFLLFHGVGSTPDSLLFVGKRIADEFPSAMVVSVAAPFACDLGAGLQWFSVQGISEDNRPKRIQDAMPMFAREVAHWQSIANVNATQTSLIGFSQGAIIALAASALEPSLASHITAHSGRFATLPVTMPKTVSHHLIHGALDEIVPLQYFTDAVQRLTHLNAKFTADVLPNLGHHMNEESLDVLVSGLKKLLT